MKTIELDRNHHGQTVTVPFHSLLIVRLSENPTTGYRWVMEDADNEYVHLLREDFETSRERGIGAAGQKVIRLQPRKKGEYRLALALSRTWENSHETEYKVDLIIE